MTTALPGEPGSSLYGADDIFPSVKDWRWIAFDIGNEF